MGIDAFVLRVIKDALLIVDENEIQFANNSFENLCDYTSNQIITEPSLLIKDSERQEFFRVVKKLLSNEHTFNEAVVECHNKHSGPFISKVVFHPYRDVEDSLSRCVCIFTDPLFYKPLFDNIEAPLGLIECSRFDKDCKLLKANPAAATLFGIEHSEAIQSSLSGSDRQPTRYSFEFSEEQVIFFSKTRSSSSPLITSLKLVATNNKEDGGTLWLSATATYIGRSLQGRSIFSFVGKEVLNELQHVQAAALKNNIETETSFLAKMVHELRSPLSGLLGMSSMLSATGMTIEQRDYMKTMESCGDSMSGLISNLLDLSCLERNRVVLTNQPIDIIQCIEEALDIVSIQARTKEVELLYDIDQVPSVSSPRLKMYGDPVRVKQILINLLSNAIKFTETKGEVVQVQARLRRDQTGGETEAVFLVTDHGVGIPKDALVRIFSPFTQADVSTEKKFGGTGIGLAIVKALTTLMRGTVSVESVEGQKTTFRVTIPSGAKEPKKRGREERCSKNRLLKLSRDFLSFSFVGKTAKISLDSKELASSLERRLTTWGMRVIPSSSEEKPSVLLCELPTNSNYTSNEIVVVGWEKTPGFEGRFLRKPIQEEALGSAICSALGISAPTKPLPERLLRSLSPIHHYRILVVDDNILNRKITANMLEVMSCAPSAIYTASNGKEALESIQQTMPDIVLMDLNMPVMGGLEAARMMRATFPHNQRPVIIALTGNATEQCKSECLQAGMNDFLCKPIRSDDLLQVIDRSFALLGMAGLDTENT